MLTKLKNKIRMIPALTRLSRVPYFHGGAPGLKVGDYIIPRNVHPDWKNRALNYQGVPAEALGDMGETVSFTIDHAVALAYAAEYLHFDGTRIPGTVYEIAPIETPQVDPDWKFSFPAIARCRQGAKIVAIHETAPVEPNPRVLVRALAEYYTYAQHPGKVFDDQGYVILSPELEGMGYTVDVLRSLGPWAPKWTWLGPEAFPPPEHLPPLL